MEVIYKRGRRNELDMFEKERKRFNRELRDCMHCRFFWGNNSGCARQRCCKPEEKKQIEMPEECKGCPYYRGEGYCFPCMRKLMGK